MEITLDSINEKLTGILQAMARQRFGDDDMWGVQEVADLLKLEAKTVRNHIIPDKSFPKPYLLPTGGKRYRAGEVKAWAYRHPVRGQSKRAAISEAVAL